ncbi:MAG: DNA-directed polymerase [Desertimonas sp.]|nr:DNA-directed polymerase [Desertimonas sp.]
MKGEATILHADLDAFFAAVEQRDDPNLRGRPVIVGIGVVMCASYEARARGVRGAMGGGEARRLCPDAVFVTPRLSAYTEASRAVFEVFDDTTPFVEGISVDEAFLDVGGLRRIAGTPEEIARGLRREVRERVGLPISVGVARTKFLAKVASAVSKPDGLLVVPPDDELGFLHPLPIERVWGIGAKTAAKLHARGIHQVGDIAALPEDAVVAILGRASGHHIHALSHNRDARPVRGGRRRRSIGSQRALGRSPRTAPALDAVLVGLVDRVTRRLRSARRVGRTVMLRLRFDDFTRSTRSHTLDHATADTATILTIARGLLAASMPRIGRDGVTLVGLTIANLADDSVVQLALPFHHRGPVDGVLDDVKDRFGSTSITRAVLLGRNDDFEMPRLPD